MNINALKEYIEREVNARLKREFEKEKPKIIADIAKRVATDVERLFSKVISDFYDDYSPKKYDRNYSMFDMLEQYVDVGHGRFNIDVGDQAMTTMKTGGSLYDIVYKQGWHGGPIWFGGVIAERADTSPHEAFTEALEKYGDTELTALKEEVAKEHMDTIMRNAGF